MVPETMKGEPELTVGWTGTEKKALAKSTTEKYVVSGGMNDNMLYGLDTSGARWYTAAFTAFRSCTNLHSINWPPSQIVLTEKIVEQESPTLQLCQILVMTQTLV